VAHVDKASVEFESGHDGHLDIGNQLIDLVSRPEGIQAG
jgi:hypothetical protein